MFIRGSLARARQFFEKKSPAVRKPRFHFVEDYQRHVNSLLASYSLDQAMSLAVGGHYQSFGRLERELIILCGLQPDHYLIDIGCGSGRLALSLRNYLRGKYLGTDVVPELLDYARSQCPSHWRFDLV